LQSPFIRFAAPTLHQDKPYQKDVHEEYDFRPIDKKSKYLGKAHALSLQRSRQSKTFFNP
jgi:hypothetical protein